MSKKFLLIKAWGYGFWSDIDHILGQLLVAELTNRIPIVHWGDNSNYRDPEDENAFENYFEPISPYSIDDLFGQSYRFYPPKWTENNLRANNINKWNGSDSRLPSFSCLSRNEDVVVSDFHGYLYDLMPYIDLNHPLAGKSPQTIYRYLFHKYFNICSEIRDEIEQFWSENLANHPTIAVHVRGSDKIYESASLKQINHSYYDVIDFHLQSVPNCLIFLLTDDTFILEEYKQIYGEKLRYTNCIRTSTDVGIHYIKHPSRKKIGIDILKDTYLAAKCDYFVGNGHSNVSTTILHIKDWGNEQYFLLTENRLFSSPIVDNKQIISSTIPSNSVSNTPNIPEDNIADFLNQIAALLNQHENMLIAKIRLLFFILKKRLQGSDNHLTWTEFLYFLLVASDYNY